MSLGAGEPTNDHRKLRAIGNEGPSKPRWSATKAKSGFEILAQWCIFPDEMSQKLVGTIQAARDAYERSEWADATELFLSADAESELEIDDLEALVWAAGVSARDRVMLATLERVYAHHSANENHEQCARAAFWCGLRNMLIGEVGLGSGWLQRAAKHAEQTPPDCVQRGYLLLPQVYMHRGKAPMKRRSKLLTRPLPSERRETNRT